MATKVQYKIEDIDGNIFEGVHETEIEGLALPASTTEQAIKWKDVQKAIRKSRKISDVYSERYYLLQP